MEQALFDILDALKAKERLDERELTKIINRHNKRILETRRFGNCDEPNGSGNTQNHPPAPSEPAKARPLSKRQLMAFYLDVQKNQPERWSSWGLSDEQQRRLVRTLQMKPRRTASGVATITVLTKPWKCSSNCLYCPNDLRMPKSYLADEPACQRAERTFFDPCLQVATRLKALTEMGHITDKVELIVLGGTWSDYPESYQIWFIRELFRALNDGLRASMPTNRQGSLATRNSLRHSLPKSSIVSTTEKQRTTRHSTVSTAKTLRGRRYPNGKRQRGKSSKPSTMPMSTGSTA